MGDFDVFGGQCLDERLPVIDGGRGTEERPRGGIAVGSDSTSSRAALNRAGSLAVEITRPILAPVVFAACLVVPLNADPGAGGATHRAHVANGAVVAVVAEARPDERQRRCGHAAPSRKRGASRAIRAREGGRGQGHVQPSRRMASRRLSRRRWLT